MDQRRIDKANEIPREFDREVSSSSLATVSAQRDATLSSLMQHKSKQVASKIEISSLIRRHANATLDRIGD